MLPRLDPSPSSAVISDDNAKLLLRAASLIIRFSNRERFFEAARLYEMPGNPLPKADTPGTLHYLRPIGSYADIELFLLYDEGNSPFIKDRLIVYYEVKNIATTHHKIINDSAGKLKTSLKVERPRTLTPGPRIPTAQWGAATCGMTPSAA